MSPLHIQLGLANQTEYSRGVIKAVPSQGVNMGLPNIDGTELLSRWKVSRLLFGNMIRIVIHMIL